ncbi:MAG TPA: TIM-barrel domain-containing protein [Pyrinomonadaceae bacterium]|nr:TIM-barrel domain-containing protein [Pyrinomonadaceae bacterium]
MVETLLKRPPNMTWTANPSRRAVLLVICFLFLISCSAHLQAQVLGDPVDVSQDFQKMENVYFIGSSVKSFDTATGQGTLQWDRYLRNTTLSFNKIDVGLARGRATEFPGSEYDQDPVLPFSISFVSPRTIRVRMSTRSVPITDSNSLMLAGPVPTDKSWAVQENAQTISYKSANGEVRIIKQPWHIEIYDKAGKLLTRTQNIGDPVTYITPIPFSFVRRSSDLSRRMAATFLLQHDEKLFGCGESFTRLNKRGQHVVAYTRDGMGTQNEYMYKPIPFFMSSNGYGMFVHTSAPVTFDFGKYYDAHNVIYSGDENLDLFIFLGDPKDIVSEYTAITGRSPVPPLWSFGFWMSRITYNSEDQVRKVAADLRSHKVPTDVIHLDTGWFETDWRSDYKFSSSRFKDPAKMLADLKQMGFHVSLWQYTYFTSKNDLWKDMVDKGLEVKNEGGQLPFEDATLDVSNPEAVKWYQGKLAGLLNMGVGAIKVDFGEGAPLTGQYTSGRTGWYEHNLYPLRYNKAVADITKEITGENVIWARSAWAGSQRYPLHWGGDAENTDSAMAAELRGGLSFGLSGFTYWSHDVGGFVQKAPRDLYRRWLGWGVLTSHTRAHGAPPREPWEYDEALTEDFRRALGLKYSLMPYIYAQAKDSSAHGYPMLRTLFFEYPNDQTSWMIDDEYMFGSSLLVAPLMESNNTRKVYLPPGNWIDYQTNKAYEGGKWHDITAGQIPVILLVKDHSVLPHLKVAQSTSEMDWSNVELRVFSSDNAPVSGWFTSPQSDVVSLELVGSPRGYTLKSDPLAGKVKWQITRASAAK